MGEEEKQIVAGIRGHYTPEQLAGRQIVVVNNLQEAMLPRRGIARHVAGRQRRRRHRPLAARIEECWRSGATVKSGERGEGKHPGGRSPPAVSDPDPFPLPLVHFGGHRADALR